MRIDYNEPKKSYTSTQTSQNRTRNESSGGSKTTAIIITCLISLGIGFGSGWVLSQRSAKKAFKAAMEQQSLENSARNNNPQPAPPKPQTVAPAAADPQQSAQGGAPAAPAATGSQASPEPPLSFYKNLPSGQKSNVLGSGINARDEKPAKQPLQAAIPANIAQLQSPQNSTENSKPPAPAVPEKAAGRPESGPFAVQVASLSLKSEAETLKAKLSSKGYNVYIVESNQGNKGIWYRVRVGRGLEPDAAKELSAKLGKNALVVPEKD